MSDTSNAVKASQLGMPFGTASGRLRKILLFRAAQKLKEDDCFKCGKKIVRADDFTIEHKKPWLHVSADLFWDLNNIAYSHSWCNKTDRTYFPRPKIKRPEGMNWCNRHKKFLPVEQFSKNRNNSNGLHSLCKECQHYTREIFTESPMTVL